MIKPTSKLVYLLSASMITGSMFLASCGKDDDESIRPAVEFPSDFSEKTPEQNKAQIQQDGIELVNKMEDLKSSTGIKTTISMVNWMDAASLPETGRAASQSKAGRIMRMLAELGKGSSSASDVLSGMRTREGEDQTLSESFNSAKGTFTYNKTDNTWSHTAGGDKVIFVFPASETATTNNAKFTIYGLTTVTANGTSETMGSEELPTALYADLSVDNNKVIEYAFTASYKANGDPTKVNTSLIIAPFKLSFSAINTTSEVATDYSFTMNNENLISFGMGASGNFNTENSGETSDIVNEASTYFQLMNIKFAGKIDVDKYMAAIENAQTVQAEAEALNQSIDLIVYYADTKEKIADGEFYGTIEEFCWDSDFDGIDDECDNEDVIDVRLVFADDSKVNLDTYVEEGFDQLTTSIEDFITELENDLN